MKQMTTMNRETKRSRWMRYGWLSVGFLSLALGTIGLVLPILPTVPFYMATLFCFGKGSTRLHQWFIGTSMYTKHVAPFERERALTRKSKISIITTVTITMGIGFYCMSDSIVGRSLLGIVWILHVIAMVWIVKTKPRSL